MIVRDAHTTDTVAFCEIYNPYILETAITFEEQALDPSILNDRLQQTQHIGLPWLVLEDPSTHTVLGYAYAAPWKARSAYRYTVESSIYLAKSIQGQGFGQILYGHLLERLQQQQLHTVIAILAMPNPGSVAFHKAMGFQQTGHLTQVGFKFNQWWDVTYWQRHLT